MDEFVRFINQCPTQYHLLEACAEKLRSAGFVELKAGDEWDLAEQSSYFVRKRGALYAFRTSRGHELSVICGQLDSPSLVLKPINDRDSKEYKQLGVAIYGNANLHTWFDRDLTIAGRIFVRKGNRIECKLINLNRPLLKIPSLAIHFDSAMNSSFQFNIENHLLPIYGLESDKENKQQTKIASANSNEAKEKQWCVVNQEGALIGYLDLSLNFHTIHKLEKKRTNKKEEHNNALFGMIADSVGISQEDIIDFDLHLIDCNKATSWGSDFISGARLESATSCYSAVETMIAAHELQASSFQLMALVESTENAAAASYSAQSSYIKRLINRLASTLSSYNLLISNSCFVCVSAGFAANPNYMNFYEPNFLPRLNGGPVLQYASRVNFITNAYTATIARTIASKNGIELQSFLYRNGSIVTPSVGTVFASTTGMAGFDIGMPLLANGSIRETMTYVSLNILIKFLKAFFKDFESVLQAFT